LKPGHRSATIAYRVPIAYSIDDRGVVRTRASGRVTFAEMRDHVERVANDPERATPVRELFDGREVTSFGLGSAQVRAALSLAGEHRDAFGEATLAIVAGSDVFYGMARVAQALASLSPFTIRTFRDYEEGERWIGS
jgi:hypothetical protein